MMKALLSEQDVQFYQTNGYFFTPRILSEEQLNAAIEAQERFYQGEHQTWPFKKVPICGWKQGDKTNLRKNDYVSLIVPELRDLILDPVIGQIASELCGERVRLWQDQLSLKEAEDKEAETTMGWHTDRQYWSCCSSDSMITAWIPFEDMEVEMGPIMFLEGSHRWNNLEGMSFFRKDLDGLEREIVKHGYQLKRVPAVLKRGQVSFHHCKTMHGSGPNTSSRPRRALSIHMQPVSNRPVDNRFHIVKILCSEAGDKNFDHPLLFPLLGTK